MSLKLTRKQEEWLTRLNEVLEKDGIIASFGIKKREHFDDKAIFYFKYKHPHRNNENLTFSLDVEWLEHETDLYRYFVNYPQKDVVKDDNYLEIADSLNKKIENFVKYNPYPCKKKNRLEDLHKEKEKEINEVKEEIEELQTKLKYEHRRLEELQKELDVIEQDKILDEENREYIIKVTGCHYKSWILDYRKYFDIFYRVVESTNERNSDIHTYNVIKIDPKTDEEKLVYSESFKDEEFDCTLALTLAYEGFHKEYFSWDGYSFQYSRIDGIEIGDDLVLERQKEKLQKEVQEQEKTQDLGREL